MALVLNGELAGALARAKRTRDAFPEREDGLLSTVCAFDQAGARSEGDALVAYALARERETLSKTPGALGPLYRCAWITGGTGRGLARGEACGRRLLERMPGEARYYGALARVLYRKGDEKAALELIQTCIRLEPTNTHWLHQLVRWLEEQRKKK